MGLEKSQYIIIATGQFTKAIQPVLEAYCDSDDGHTIISRRITNAYFQCLEKITFKETDDYRLVFKIKDIYYISSDKWTTYLLGSREGIGYTQNPSTGALAFSNASGKPITVSQLISDKSDPAEIVVIGKKEGAVVD